MKIKSAKHQRRLEQAAMANQAGKILEAESLCRPVVEKYPENFKANLLMAAIYVNHKNYEQALTFCEKANKVKNDPKAVQLLAAIQRRLGHYSESESTLVSDQKAENTRVFFSEQGYNALIQGIFQEAKYYYNLALIIDPYHPMDRFNRATLILAEKDYPLGWKEYEWRFKAGKTEKNYFESIPRWQGEQGQSILVWQEQGVGDTLMFASCLNELLGKNNLVYIYCEERLQPLLKRSFPKVEFFETQSSSSFDQIDYQISFGSLPKIFRLSQKDFSSRNSYLVSDYQLVKKWKSRYAGLEKKMVVGISWRGSLDPDIQKRRSLDLDQLVDILRLPEIAFINLQYGNVEPELTDIKNKFGLTVHHWSDVDPIANIDDFAAQVAAVDLVISVDNTTVHMAGALGVPAWVLLSYIADWRWGLGDRTCEWYPLVCLFWQPKPGEWEPVISKAKNCLQKAIQSKKFDFAGCETCFDLWVKENHCFTDQLKQHDLNKIKKHEETHLSSQYLELISAYQKMHEQGYEVSCGNDLQKIESSQSFWGHEIANYIENIKILSQLTQAETLLDYGSGKGAIYYASRVKTLDGYYDSISKYWGVDIHCYDPGYSPFSKKPERVFDLVVCTDVLEHIPEQDLNWLIKDIYCHANKGVFLTVACYPAMARLPDGQNAHVTVQPLKWWRELIADLARSFPYLLIVLCCDELDKSRQITKHWFIIDQRA